MKCGNPGFSSLLQLLTSVVSLQVVHVLLLREKKEEENSKLGGTIVRAPDKTGRMVTIETMLLVFILICIICIPETDCRIEPRPLFLCSVRNG